MGTTPQPGVSQEVLLLRGASILRADTLEELATLDDDGQWRTPQGVVTDSIGLPRQTPDAIVKPAALQEAHRKQDAAWLADALRTLRRIAVAHKQLTVDDCWQEISSPPRHHSQMSALMVAGQRHGWIEKTSAHRRSVRTVNGGRTVRIWRSRIHTASTTTPHQAGRAGDGP
jgi:hypothetical protein